MTDTHPASEPAPQAHHPLGPSRSDEPGSDHSGDPHHDDITPDTPQSIADVEAAVELAEAERAMALHVATAEQADGVARAGRERHPQERRQAWRQRRRMNTALSAPMPEQAGSAGDSGQRGTTVTGLMSDHEVPGDRGAISPAHKSSRSAAAIAAAIAFVALLLLLGRRRARSRRRPVDPQAAEGYKR